MYMDFWLIESRGFTVHDFIPSTYRLGAHNSACQFTTLLHFTTRPIT